MSPFGLRPTLPSNVQQEMKMLFAFTEHAEGPDAVSGHISDASSLRTEACNSDSSATTPSISGERGRPPSSPPSRPSLHFQWCLFADRVIDRRGVIGQTSEEASLQMWASSSESSPQWLMKSHRLS
ncbi:hypothetical protein EYF80_031869 [Liparis tanakae]|uniref:Uncharacterized protein n=1 Tax=Liparis tanakae TaxID=230148 RepID=A0A4Z2GYV1_9TELE|nr:hypothetical protein EYF80_031869 [Liparis tanakae]